MYIEEIIRVKYDSDVGKYIANVLDKLITNFHLIMDYLGDRVFCSICCDQ